MRLQLWGGLLWSTEIDEDGPYALCPSHRVILDILRGDGVLLSQGTVVVGVLFKHVALLCPTDGQRFPLQHGNFWDLQRHFINTLRSIDFKDAEIVSLDGYQVPIAKALTPIKDDEYWAEVRINDTKQGKQLVVYAGRRGDRDKAQMFLDLKNDKVTFDQNNLHPNDIFTRVIADFRSGRSVKLDDGTRSK